MTWAIAGSPDTPGQKGDQGTPGSNGAPLCTTVGRLTISGVTGDGPGGSMDFLVHHVVLEPPVAGGPPTVECHGDANVPKVPLGIAATGHRVIELAARHADRIGFAVGADMERWRARSTSHAARRPPAAAVPTGSGDPRGSLGLRPLLRLQPTTSCATTAAPTRPTPGSSTTPSSTASASSARWRRRCPDSSA